MNNKAVQKYLQHYAEAEINALTEWPADCCYQHVVLIPAYQESVSFLQNLLTAPWFQSGVLVILIINQPDNQTNSTSQQELCNFALNSGSLRWKAENLTLIQPAPLHSSTSDSCGHLLLVNRFEQGIPVKQGVGLARKIGADIAVSLIARGNITTPWICSTDADAWLPDNYFSPLATLSPEYVAACYPFEHIAGPNSDPEVTVATLTYQRAMQYYVAGLCYAGSSYAFFALGSTLAFKAEAYAAVRGFPKRAAGEDFYLLNKLAKIGHISQLSNNTLIRLQARLSDRVPFGTGVSAANIIALNRQNQPFCYYHPTIFINLRNLLRHFEQLWQVKHQPEPWLQELPDSSTHALYKLGFLSMLQKLSQQCRSKQQFDHQLTGWFDGLKTLQFIHLLRDSDYPNLPLETAIQQAKFTI
ncbi:MAG: hypothetical protein ACPG51_09915 [Thiolinea sp.]